MIHKNLDNKNITKEFLGDLITEINAELIAPNYGTQKPKYFPVWIHGSDFTHGVGMKEFFTKFKEYSIIEPSLISLTENKASEDDKKDLYTTILSLFQDLKMLDVRGKYSFSTKHEFELFCEQLTAHTKLNELELRNFPLDEETIVPFCRALENNTSLRKLVLEGVEMNRERLATLFSAINTRKTIKDLHLNAVVLNPETVEYGDIFAGFLITAGENTTVHMINNHLQSKCLKKIAESLPVVRNVISLAIAERNAKEETTYENEVEIDGQILIMQRTRTVVADFVEGLTRNASIKIFRMNNETDKMSTDLCSAIPLLITSNKTLESFHIRNAHVVSKGVASSIVQALKKNKTMHTFFIDSYDSQVPEFAKSVHRLCDRNRKLKLARELNERVKSFQAIDADDVKTTHFNL